MGIGKVSEGSKLHYVKHEIFLKLSLGRLKIITVDIPASAVHKKFETS